MRKLALPLLGLCVGLLMFGCSESPVTTPDADQPTVTLVPRPEFIETRPPAEVQNAILALVDFEPLHGLAKKPPSPPPDTGGSDPNPNPAHKYAYVVGIADYEGTVNDLQYPDDDAVAFRSYLQSQGFTVQMDLNQNATAADIEAGLQWLAAQAVPGDEIAFCYSGHGAKAPGCGSSIISHDLYYVTHGFVMSYFNGVNCTKKMTAMDACVPGDFHPDTQTGTMMATASTTTSSYDAPEFQHGAWTYFWLKAVNNEGKVYAEDAASYAESGMRAWAKPYRLRVSPSHTDKYAGSFDM